MIGTCMQAVARSIVTNGQTAAVSDIKNNFSSIYVRQTHDDTRARIEDTLNRLRKEKGQPTSTPLLVSNGKKQIFYFLYLGSTMTNNDVPPPFSVLLSVEEQMKLIEDEFSPEERAKLAAGGLIDLENTEPAEIVEDTEEAATARFFANCPWMEESENDDNDDDSDSLSLGDSDLSDDDSDDGDDDDSGYSTKKKAKKKKVSVPGRKPGRPRTKVPIAEKNGDDEDASKLVLVAAAKRRRLSKMSEEAEQVANEQKECKRKRGELLGDENGKQQLLADLISYTEVATVCWYERVKNTQGERTFAQLVREDESENEHVQSLKRSLTRIDLEIAQSIDKAASGMPLEFQFLRDFVADSDQLNELSEANVAGATQCAALRRDFAPEKLVAFEVVRTDANGNSKSTRQVFHRSLARLLHATWFLTNMIFIAEQLAVQRLGVLLRGAEKNATFSTAIRLLRTDTKQVCVANLLFSKFRTHLDTLDNSTMLFANAK